MHANDKSWLFNTTDGRRYGKGGWRKFALHNVPKWVRAAEKISCDLSHGLPLPLLLAGGEPPAAGEEPEDHRGLGDPVAGDVPGADGRRTFCYPSVLGPSAERLC